MYLDDRAPVADLIAPVLQQAIVPVLISSVTLTEVLVLPARHGSRADVESFGGSFWGFAPYASCRSMRQLPSMLRWSGGSSAFLFRTRRSSQWRE